ncbi:MAG: type II toxin-antitoxin system VapC family toxin [Candidatus Levybacteria bacterium]|nr:type II toxin-antitoxin system VapC family toxin [Candidatus Levybacteria bacterium]
MKYLLDTDIVINHLRKRVMINKAVLESGAAISIITLGELLYGAEKSDNPETSVTILEKSLNILGLELVNLSKNIMVEFAKIKTVLEKNGIRLEDFDLLIAATAKANSLTLVTKNLHHFTRVPNLQIIN